MNKASGTLRTIFIVLGSSWFAIILNILRVLVLPTKLHDTGLGLITLAISYTTFFGIFTSLGISTYLVRAVARDTELADRYISNALALRLVMGAGVLVILLAIARFLNYSEQTQTVILIMGLQMTVFTISNVFESGLQALGQMSWRAIATAIGQVSATLLGVGALLLGYDVVVYALCLLTGMAIQLVSVLSYYFLKHHIKFSVDRVIMRALLVGGMPLFLWGFLQTAYGQIDATILSLFTRGHEEVIGWLGAAQQITNVLILVPTAISAVALPILCELYVRSESDFDRSSSRALVTTLLIMAPLGAGMAVASADILRFLPYKSEFLNAAPALSLQALALPVTGIMMVLATLAVAIGQEKQWVKISIFAVIIFPPLYIGLIGWFQANVQNGATGASLANLIGESALMVWAWFVLPRNIRHPELVQKGLQIGALVLIMVAVVALLQNVGVSLLIYIPVGGIIYGIGAWLMHLVTPGDVQIVRNAVLRRGRRAEATG